ncbi:opioid-binding protein/cell adhesion molecule homolog [Plakobranchus ocellatus]|uniref:Opioid-binding protein/cell adhesion molecule homolog n=1 Tax=Plakobranchus ocellatus TaxID=259542 RepID=A0AAV3YBR3_9GAST|nr:opioid-binding protein/cell adhesion molecule homolog [Plakobranchus ocellatus]
MAALRLLVCFVMCITTFVVSDDPRIDITETDPPMDPVYDMIIQEKDKDVQLTCIVENQREGYDVMWTVLSNKPNSSAVQITTATRSHDAFRWAIDQPSNTAWRLRIQNAQVADEGVYTCQVQVTAQNYIRDQRRVRVVQIPQISDLDTSSDMTKTVDMDASLECYATGRPEPLIKWTRMAGELLPNGGTEFQGNILAIDRVMSDHAGIYKCTALNSAGRDEREIRLSVIFAPELSTGMRVARQKIGYVKELVCNIKAYPPSQPNQIAWMHEGRSVESTGRIEIRNIPGASNRITSILTIYGVQREDYGSYTCSASNSKGSGQITMSLLESDVPTPDRSNQIRSAAALTSIHLTTFLMLLSVCVLHQARWGR